MAQSRNLVPIWLKIPVRLPIVTLLPLHCPWKMKASDLNHFDKNENSFSVYLSLYINVAFGVSLASGVWWKVMSGFSLQAGGGLAASSASSLPPKIHWIFFTKPHLPQMPHCCALYRDQLKSVHQVWWILLQLLDINSASTCLQHSCNLDHRL